MRLYVYVYVCVRGRINSFETIRLVIIYMKSVITHVYCHCVRNIYFVCNTNSMRDVDLTLAGNIPSRGDSRIKIRHRGNAKA